MCLRNEVNSFVRIGSFAAASCRGNLRLPLHDSLLSIAARLNCCFCTTLQLRATRGTQSDLQQRIDL